MTRVEVKDFGPIAKASVELKPLTVLLGPNNSGKSYLALAIYCLHRALYSEPRASRSRTLLRRRSLEGLLTPELLKQTEGEIKKIWPDARSFRRGPIKVADIPSGLQEVINTATNWLANAFSLEFGRELERCYGTELSKLVRRGMLLSSTNLEVSISQEERGFSWEMQAADERLATKNLESNILDETIDIRHTGLPLRVLIDDPEFFLVRVISELHLLDFRSLVRKPHYMPASRSGIMLGHKTLAGLLVGQASRAWVEPIEVPRLPGVVTDLIQALLLLEGNYSPDAGLAKVISFLEDNVTRGTVDMEAIGEYPEVYYQNETGKYSFHQTSSMVTEIAPLVLFLKHLVRPGNLFIIEEPESHIDADNQMKLARAIAMLVNSGVHVLITTHSDFFVSQINNLLLLSEVSHQKRTARRYSRSEVLHPEDVSGYFFDPGPEGSRVHELPVTSDVGIPIPHFTDAHSALYDEAVELEHSSR